MGLQIQLLNAFKGMIITRGSQAHEARQQVQAALENAKPAIDELEEELWQWAKANDEEVLGEWRQQREEHAVKKKRAENESKMVELTDIEAAIAGYKN